MTLEESVQHVVMTAIQEVSNNSELSVEKSEEPFVNLCEFSHPGKGQGRA